MFLWGGRVLKGRSWGRVDVWWGNVGKVGTGRLYSVVCAVFCYYLLRLDA